MSDELKAYKDKLIAKPKSLELDDLGKPLHPFGVVDVIISIIEKDNL